MTTSASPGGLLAVPFVAVIALAWIVVLWMIAGTSALLTLVPTLNDWSQGLMVFTVITFTASLMNLIPFVKLDGYIALMNQIDVAHLRDKAIADGSSIIAADEDPRGRPFAWCISGTPN